MSKIAIIMPCYNAAETIKQTLSSIAEQTYEKWFLYAVNDGSSDNTGEILENFHGQYPDKVKVITQENQGQVKSKNNALKLATEYDFIAFIDSDDLWAKDKLKQQLSAMTDHPATGLCYTNGYYINAEGKVKREIGYEHKLTGHCFNEILLCNGMVASSVMVRQSILKQTGLFDEHLKACENWELWTRIASIAPLMCLPTHLICYRQHDKNMSHDINRMMGNRLAVIEKNLVQYSDRMPLITKICKKAKFLTYYFFGKNALWQLNLNEARRYLCQAIACYPFSVKAWMLLFKSYLGDTGIKQVRNGRRQLSFFFKYLKGI